MLRQETDQALDHDLGVVFAPHDKTVFALEACGATGAQQMRGNVLLDEFGLPLFEHQHCLFALAKTRDLLRHQGIHHIEHHQRQLTVAIRIGQAQLLQRANERVVQTALHHQTKLRQRPFEKFVQLRGFDVAPRCRHAHIVFELFVFEGGRRMGQAVVMKTTGGLLQFHTGNMGGLVVARHKAALHMTGANAQAHHHRCVGSL